MHVANKHQKIQSNDINHGYRAAILKKSSVRLLPFYMAVATYCCYEQQRRTMRTAIASVENPEAPSDFNIFLIGCIIVCHVFPFIVCFFKMTRFIRFLLSAEKEFLFPSDLFPS